MTYINGWAFAQPEVRESFQKDFLEALTALGIPLPKIMDNGGLDFSENGMGEIYKHAERISDGYARTTYRLSEECRQLTARQKLLIADSGNACFGGIVDGLTVTVYTD